MVEKYNNPVWMAAIVLARCPGRMFCRGAPFIAEFAFYRLLQRVRGENVTNVNSLRVCSALYVTRLTRWIFYFLIFKKIFLNRVQT